MEQKTEKSLLKENKGDWKNLLRFEKSLSELKKFYDYDDNEYRCKKFNN